MRKVFVIFAFLAIALLFPFDQHAQTRSKSPKRSGASTSPSTAVVTELDRQRLFLQKVTSRYEAVSINEFTPYFSYSYIWKALKENREHLARQVRRLTSAQSIEVKRGYEMLEQDVLREFVDQQLNVLISELDLNAVQINEVEKLLNEDLKQKRSLLSAPGHTPQSFAERIATLSDTTEKKILSILFPEQVVKFRKQVSFARDRLVG